jgi:hypothetical protein
MCPLAASPDAAKRIINDADALLDYDMRRTYL